MDKDRLPGIRTLHTVKTRFRKLLLTHWKTKRNRDLLTSISAVLFDRHRVLALSEPMNQRCTSYRRNSSVVKNSLKDTYPLYGNNPIQRL